MALKKTYEGAEEIHGSHQVWKGGTYPKTGMLVRKKDAQTTTADANQVLDAGATNETEDLTIVDNAITRVYVLLFVKKNTVDAGGTIELRSDYRRHGAAAPTLIVGSDTGFPVYHLEGATLDGTTARLFINAASKCVEVQVSPESAETLDWGLVRTQTVGGAEAAF